MSQAVLRIVKAPGRWRCGCGNPIEPTQDCAKMGSRVLCLDCLLKAIPARPPRPLTKALTARPPRPLTKALTARPPRPLTKAQRLIEEARYLALDEIAELTHFVEGDQLLLFQCLESDIATAQNELGLRSMPYHGGAHNLCEGLDSHQLDAMLNIYNEFYQSIKEE